MSENKTVQRDLPEIIDIAEEHEGFTQMVSPFEAQRPGGKRRTKKRRSKRRRPGPDLEQGGKRPTDGTGWPRPTGDGMS